MTRLLPESCSRDVADCAQYSLLRANAPHPRNWMGVQKVIDAATNCEIAESAQWVLALSSSDEKMCLEISRCEKRVL
jgi:hypothetical protein